MAPATRIDFRRGDLASSILHSLPSIRFLMQSGTGAFVGALPLNAPFPFSPRGTAEQWIKEGKYALNWTRLSCRRFADNQVRLQLFALAYNLANFLLRRLALPRGVKHWSLTTLREKLVKIGAKVTQHAKYVTFQMAEVAIPRQLFREILRRIARLRASPLAPATG